MYACFWITTSETCMHISGLQHLRHVCIFLDYNIWDMYACFWITTSETCMHISGLQHLRHVCIFLD